MGVDGEKLEGRLNQWIEQVENKVKIMEKKLKKQIQESSILKVVGNTKDSIEKKEKQEEVKVTEWQRQGQIQGGEEINMFMNTFLLKFSFLKFSRTVFSRNIDYQNF